MKPASKFIAEAKELLKANQVTKATDKITDGLNIYPSNKTLNLMLQQILNS